MAEFNNSELAHRTGQLLQHERPGFEPCPKLVTRWSARHPGILVSWRNVVCRKSKTECTELVLTVSFTQFDDRNKIEPLHP